MEISRRAMIATAAAATAVAAIAPAAAASIEDAATLGIGPVGSAPVIIGFLQAYRREYHENGDTKVIARIASRGSFIIPTRGGRLTGEAAFEAYHGAAEFEVPLSPECGPLMDMIGSPVAIGADGIPKMLMPGLPERSHA